MNDREHLSTFLAEQKYMTLAVTLENGKPWATPVRIKQHEGNVFEWDSAVVTEHSKAIENNPAVAISIWTPDSDTTEQFGFYAEATAERITEPAGDHAISRYRATVTTSWVNDASFIKREVTL